MFNVPEIPIMSSTTSSITNSENMSKYSSTQGISELPPQTVPLTFAPAQQQSAPVSFPPQQQQKQQQQKPQQQQQKQRQAAPVSFPPQQQQQSKAAPASYPPQQAPVSFPPQQAPVNFPPQQAPVSFAPQNQEFQQNFHQQQHQLQQQQHNLQQNQNQQFNQYQQTSSTSVTSMTSKTYQQTSSSSSSSTTAKTFMPQIVKTLPQTMSPKSPIQRNDAVSPRSGMSASPVTPGILKMQIKLDAAVPVPPGSVGQVVNGNGNANSIGINGRSSTGGKSPVPFLNTAPAPFGFPALSVQTPETIAQLAPSPSVLEPQFQNPKPLPLITNTEIPNYSSNYNTAARPFGQCKDYYRPIHMAEAKKMHPPVIYTDF